MHLLSRVLLVLAIFISTSNAYWETTNIQHYPYEQGEPHLPLATPLDVLRRRLREFIKPNAQTVPCLVFWTGNYTIHTDPLDLTSPVVELSVRYQAARIAQHFLSTPARPCRTLEMSLDVVTDARRRKIYLPGPQQRDARAGKVWRWLSYDVADLVEHETHLVVGTKIRIGNVWERIEYPRIRARAQIAPSIHKYQWTFGTNIPGIQAQIRPTTFRVVPLNHQKRSMTEQDVKLTPTWNTTQELQRRSPAPVLTPTTPLSGITPTSLVSGTGRNEDAAREIVQCASGWLRCVGDPDLGYEEGNVKDLPANQVMWGETLQPDAAGAQDWEARWLPIVNTNRLQRGMHPI